MFDVFFGDRIFGRPIMPTIDTFRVSRRDGK